MATVHAAYQDRRRIVFTARGRSQVNVRETVEDGPLGYTSTELLLVALGNCVLGALLNHDLLRDETILLAEATLDAEMARNPSRVANINVQIDLEVADPALLELQDELEAASCTCPICNTLGSVEITSSLRMTAPRETAAV